MSSVKDHYLVIGAQGFIGAWICRLLIEAGHRVTGADATPDPRSADCVLADEHNDRLSFVVCDARDADAIDRLVGEGVTHVIYLAGLLRPASENDPWLSAQISIGGLMHVFRAVERRKGIHIAYASTAAVYGPAANYPGKKVTDKSVPNPTDHYGTQRLAMEMTARAFFLQHGVGSLGLRPWVVYGAGRFNGLSAQPSIAMLAAAAGKPFEIAFGNRTIVHHARDVAEAFVRGVQSNLNDAVTANIPGESISMPDLVAIINRAAPESKGKITIKKATLGQPEYLEDPTLERLIGPLPSPTQERTRETIADYRRLLAEGRITFP